MTEASSETVPAKGRWHYPAPKDRLRLFRSVPSALAFVVLALGLVAALVTGEESYVPLAAGLAALVVFLGDMAGKVTVPARAADLRLLENPDDPDVCLVAVSIVVDHRTVGRDRGVVWFEDGRLLFNGHRTSFALGGEDVVPQDEWRRLTWDRRQMPMHLVPIREPNRVVFVSFDLIRRGDGIRMRQEMNFERRINEFRRHPPGSTGPRQLPPLES